MKNILPLLALVVFLQWGCDEKEIRIPELSAGNHRVLVEELTGVRCQNCPDGSKLLVDLQEQYGEENLIVISIHGAPDFSVPYPSNAYDFRTAKGKELADYIGVFEGAPCASIDRFLPENATSLFVAPSSEWPGIIASQLDKDHKLDLYVQNTYDANTRKLDVLVNIAPEETLSGEHHLTVVITQDSIVDVQNVSNVIVPNYVHRHVLRDVLTQPSGNAITESLASGAVVTKNFSLTLPADWDAKHCSVVAYVHRGTAADKEVLQATQAHVVQ